MIYVLWLVHVKITTKQETREKNVHFG